MAKSLGHRREVIFSGGGEQTQLRNNQDPRALSVLAKHCAIELHSHPREECLDIGPLNLAFVLGRVVVLE